MLIKVNGSAVFGIEATTITVEVNIGKGIGYHLVGLPDNAVRESSYRITAALQNNKFKLPGKKIIIRIIEYVMMLHVALPGKILNNFGALINLHTTFIIETSIVTNTLTSQNL